MWATLMTISQNDESRVVQQATGIPREAILAFPQTGMGCLWQIEFGVLAGGGRATLDIEHEVTER